VAIADGAHFRGAIDMQKQPARQGDAAKPADAKPAAVAPSSPAPAAAAATVAR
jgi:hypothetical protein